MDIWVFPFWAITSNAAIFYVCFWVVTSLEFMRRSGIVGSYYNSMFTFWGSTKLFSKVLASFYILVRNVWGFQFLYIIVMLVIICPFEFSHCSGCEVISHCGFDLHFTDYWCWISFHIPVVHLYVFFGKLSIQFLCPLFNRAFCFK